MAYAGQAFKKTEWNALLAGLTNTSNKSLLEWKSTVSYLRGANLFLLSAYIQLFMKVMYQQVSEQWSAFISISLLLDYLLVCVKPFDLIIMKDFMFVWEYLLFSNNLIFILLTKYLNQCLTWYTQMFEYCWNQTLIISSPHIAWLIVKYSIIPDTTYR